MVSLGRGGRGGHPVKILRCLWSIFLFFGPGDLPHLPYLPCLQIPINKDTLVSSIVGGIQQLSVVVVVVITVLPACWNAPANMIYKEMDFPIGHNSMNQEPWYPSSLTVHILLLSKLETEASVPKFRS